MQTLAVEITNTFLDDAAALTAGCGRIIISFLMAPIERLANACDVAGVLARRRSLLRTPRARTKRAFAGTSAARREVRSRRNCFFSLRCLNDLT